KARRQGLTPDLRAALMVASFRASPADRPVFATLLEVVGREGGDHRCTGFGALLRGVGLVGAGPLRPAGEAYRPAVGFCAAGRSRDYGAGARDSRGFAPASGGRPGAARGYHAGAGAIYRRMSPNGHFTRARPLNTPGPPHGAWGAPGAARRCLEE